MTKSQISEILQKELNSVYCDTCAEQMQTEACELCHRKSMFWSLSKSTADNIADKIIK